MVLRCRKLDCEIGSIIVNRRKLYYAVCSNWLCALLRPLHFDWVSQGVLSNVMLLSQWHKKKTAMSNPAQPRKVCSSSQTKSLQAARVKGVCSFFWDQYPVCDNVAELNSMLWQECTAEVLTCYQQSLYMTILD